MIMPALHYKKKSTYSCIIGEKPYTKVYVQFGGVNYDISNNLKKALWRLDNWSTQLYFYNFKSALWCVIILLFCLLVCFWSDILISSHVSFKPTGMKGTLLCCFPLFITSYSN